MEVVPALKGIDSFDAMDQCTIMRPGTSDQMKVSAHLLITPLDDGFTTLNQAYGTAADYGWSWLQGLQHDNAERRDD